MMLIADLKDYNSCNLASFFGSDPIAWVNGADLRKECMVIFIFRCQSGIGLAAEGLRQVC